MSKANKNREQIRQIFIELCGKREFLVVVTPYLRFESNFVFLDGEEIHIRAVMTEKSAQYIPRIADLSLRFPYKLSFLEAPSKLVKFGEHEDQKTIMFSLPKIIYDNDERKNFRLESVGQTVVTFSIPSLRTIQASLNNISVTGARLTAREELSHGVLKVNDNIKLSIPLANGININNSAIVRYMNERIIGVEFHPKLPDSIQEPLTSWIFMKREEAYDFTVRLSDADGAASEGVTDIKKNKGSGKSVLLVTRDNDMYSALSKLFAEHLNFNHAMPAVASLKEAFINKPHLVILHMTNSKMEEKYLFKTLAGTVNEEVPIMLLGTDIDFEQLSELGQDFKAVSSMDWTPMKNIFLQRLVMGILRKHYESG